MGVAGRTRWAAALSACALLLGACGDGGDTSTTTAPAEKTTPTTTAGATTMPDATAPTSTTAAPGTTAAPAPQQGPPKLVEVGNFNQPVYVTSPPGDRRIFVVEKAGRVVEMAGGKAKEPAFLDIRSMVSNGGERGLLSMAFSPDYATSGLAYVSYTNTEGDSRVDEYQVDSSNPDRLDPSSRRQVLAIEQPYSNHNGGLILFAPDGTMILGYGDGGAAGDPQNRAQNLKTQLGKLLRIDPKRQPDGKPYGIPAGNPFVNKDGADPAIWAYGMRNPWRFAFDPSTKDLYVADVGQNQIEEVDFVPPGSQSGANYGWPKYEASQGYKNVQIDESNLIRPVAELRHSDGNCSITGGFFYRGSVASLNGYYLYSDFCGGVIYGLRMEGGKVAGRNTYRNMKLENPSSFGEDSSGEMYVTSLSGPVYRIAAG